MILRVEKGSPLSTNEMDNNLLELENRVTLTTDQIVDGIKTFSNIECDDIPLNDSSNKFINTKNVSDKISDVLVNSLNSNIEQSITGSFNFSSMSVPDIDPADISKKIINTKTCNDITALMGKVTVSTTLPVNPDLTPSRKIWVKVSPTIPRSILDIFYWNNGTWDIPAQGTSFADAILVIPDVYSTLDHDVSTVWVKAICPVGCTWGYFWYQGATQAGGNMYDVNGNQVSPNLIPGNMYYVQGNTAAGVLTHSVTFKFF